MTAKAVQLKINITSMQGIISLLSDFGDLNTIFLTQRGQGLSCSCDIFTWRTFTSYKMHFRQNEISSLQTVKLAFKGLVHLRLSVKIRWKLAVTRWQGINEEKKFPFFCYSVALIQNIWTCFWYKTCGHNVFLQMCIYGGTATVDWTYMFLSLRKTLH